MARFCAALARVQPVDVASSEHRRGEGGEHQLGLEAEQVQDTAPLLWIEAAHGVPALVRQQPLLCQGRLGGVRSALLGSGDSALEHRRQRVHPATTEPVPLVGVDEAVEEIGQLHDVAVSVEDGPLAGVRHAVSLGSQLAVTLCHRCR